ncbi:MAG: DUF2887 domain-containing protein [Thermosynechococcaceae cyanobacterium]
MHRFTHCLCNYYCSYINPCFSEIYFYLKLHPETEDWQAVVIFPSRDMESQKWNLYRANLNSGQI